jgi:hypothetical protein
MARLLPRRITITTALIGNIALLTLVIGALCAWLMAQWGSADIHKKEQQRLALTAGSIASLIAQAMEERHDEVRQVRDLFEREMRDAPVEQKRQVMERIQTGRQHFSWLGVVAADGEIRIGTGGLLEGGSVAGRNWFEGARQAPAFFGNIHPAKLLEPYVRNADGAPLYLLDIALPLRNVGGEIDGVVGSHFNWKMIEEAVRHAHDALPHGGEFSVAIVNSDGAILYDNRGAVGNVGEMLAGIAPGKLIEASWPNDTGRSFVAAMPVPANRAFDGLGWQIAVRESSASIDASIARMKWQVAGASLLAGLAFALLGVFAVRPVTQPLQALIGELDRFGENEAMPMVDKPHPITEINNLHQAFFGMATRVAAHKEMLRETQTEIVRTLGRAGEFRDNETGNHVFRMSLCCERLAILAGWSTAAAEQLRLASQMHDVGKIGIPDQVLLKPGRFEPEERALMEQHSEIGARILTGIDTPLTVLARTIALTHHEKWDGSGYPRRLASADIPQEGRIAALCDVFDALLSSRPYKQGWPVEKVVAFLTEQSGQHFDPELVALFLANLDDFVAIRARFQDESTSPSL